MEYVHVAFSVRVGAVPEYRRLFCGFAVAIPGSVTASRVKGSSPAGGGAGGWAPEPHENIEKGGTGRGWCAGRTDCLPITGARAQQQGRVCPRVERKGEEREAWCG